jgi:hypothetical protein
MSYTKGGILRWKKSMPRDGWFYLCAINQDNNIITWYRNSMILYNENGVELRRIANFFPNVVDSNGIIYGSENGVSNKIIAEDSQGNELYRKTLEVPLGLSVVLCDSKGNIFAKSGKNRDRLFMQFIV